MLGPTSYARPNPRDDRLLWQQHHARRDEASRDALVERFLPLARHLARRSRGGGEDEDLEQVASLGRVKDPAPKLVAPAVLPRTETDWTPAWAWPS